MDAEFGLLQPLWLILLPLVVLWSRRHTRRPSGWPRLIRPISVRYPALAELQTRPTAATTAATHSNSQRWFAAALGLALLALAQPGRYLQTLPDDAASEPVDLVLVVGTAVSMGLSDYTIDDQPVDRMSLSKRLLDGFVAEYSGRRVGLVVLGNPPALWLPLTTDKAQVRAGIARLQTTLGGRLSDMGATLQLVGRSFTDSQDAVVVMLTDGALQLGATNPEQAARALADAGMHLYVIAIGSNDPAAGNAGSSELLYSAVDLKLLQGVANAGQGALFHALDATAVRKALASIESHHRRPAAGATHQRLTSPWYPLPLLLMLLSLLLAIFQDGRQARTTSGAPP